MYCMPYYLFCRFSSVQHSRKHSSTRHYSHFPLCTGRRNMVSIDFVSSENYTTCIIYIHTHTHTHIYIHTHIYTPSRLSHVWLFVTSWTEAHQTPLSMGFSWQEYWSGLPYTYTHTHTHENILYIKTLKNVLVCILFKENITV